ncbi:YybH family protein [Methylobacterium nonmethylotrophicum]|uniref:SgcJ/EcaC family oxidoreductase n=1 Tax=Methylobacterium nonmethylotrophicum TaxID=1141884 RepID=A0A4Z0NSX4_9HYPH|nr:SgcJ/EcaC family oxidoreductase [Methylobacterium nonmethylotrophicum]TGE00509.1 SgcJ/EcaC family oxidoreductase [Methylobacterium nonmethylotrophicum]
MKKIAKSTGTSSDAASVQSGIEDALQAYETALNASNTDAVLSVFATDAVFMAPNSPSTVGAEAIRAAYDGIFQTITFDTELTVEEVVQVAPNWAFARTSSNGHVIVNAIKQRVPDANHELFILSKEGRDGWKIARYSFATTNPPPR